MMAPQTGGSREDEEGDRGKAPAAEPSAGGGTSSTADIISNQGNQEPIAEFGPSCSHGKTGKTSWVRPDKFYHLHRHYYQHRPHKKKGGAPKASAGIELTAVELSNANCDGNSTTTLVMASDQELEAEPLNLGSTREGSNENRRLHGPANAQRDIAQGPGEGSSGLTFPEASVPERLLRKPLYLSDQKAYYSFVNPALVPSLTDFQMQTKGTLTLNLSAAIWH